MKKYLINDLQGGGFCDWSHNDPATRKEIIDHFDIYRIAVELPKKALTLKNISQIWGVEFVEVKFGDRG